MKIESPGETRGFFFATDLDLPWRSLELALRNVRGSSVLERAFLPAVVAVRYFYFCGLRLVNYPSTVCFKIITELFKLLA